MLGHCLPLSSLIYEDLVPPPRFSSNGAQDVLLESSRIQPKSGRALHFVHFLAQDSHVRPVVLFQSADKAQVSPDFFYLVSVV